MINHLRHLPTSYRNPILIYTAWIIASGISGAIPRFVVGIPWIGFLLFGVAFSIPQSVVLARLIPDVRNWVIFTSFAASIGILITPFVGLTLFMTVGTMSGSSSLMSNTIIAAIFYKIFVGFPGTLLGLAIGSIQCPLLKKVGINTKVWIISSVVSGFVMGSYMATIPGIIEYFGPKIDDYRSRSIYLISQGLQAGLLYGLITGHVIARLPPRPDQSA